MRHDVEDEVVGLGHAIVPNAGEVVDGAVDIFFHDALRSVGIRMLHRQRGRQYRRAHAARYFQRAPGFRTIAYHAREIGNHVLDGVGCLLVPAAHQVGNPHCRARCSNHTSAQRREPPQRLLDIDDRQVAQRQRTNRLLAAAAALFGIEIDGHRAGDSLVAGTRVGHHLHHRARHTRIARPAGVTQYLREQRVAKNISYLTTLWVDRFAVRPLC